MFSRENDLLEKLYNIKSCIHLKCKHFEGLFAHLLIPLPNFSKNIPVATQFSLAFG